MNSPDGKLSILLLGRQRDLKVITVRRMHDAIVAIVKKLPKVTGYALTEDQGRWSITLYGEPGIAERLRQMMPVLVPLDIRSEVTDDFTAPSPQAPAFEAPAAAPARTIPNTAIGSTIRANYGTKENFGSIGCYVKTKEGIWLVSVNHLLAVNGRYLPLGDPSQGVYLGKQRISRTIIFSYLIRSAVQADAAACLLDPAI